MTVYILVLRDPFYELKPNIVGVFATRELADSCHRHAAVTLPIGATLTTEEWEVLDEWP
jgi:hypothetical protein